MRRKMETLRVGIRVKELGFVRVDELCVSCRGDFAPLNKHGRMHLRDQQDVVENQNVGNLLLVPMERQLARVALRSEIKLSLPDPLADLTTMKTKPSSYALSPSNGQTDDITSSSTSSTFRAHMSRQATAAGTSFCPPSNDSKPLLSEAESSHIVWLAHPASSAIA
ncbi:hypothetical protein HDU86_000666 [Geranomyces michiganensis]|nr:hypothetical protein HDU86_000666 [Geranomyces michiganensis]